MRKRAAATPSVSSPAENGSGHLWQQRQEVLSMLRGRRERTFAGLLKRSEMRRKEMRSQTDTRSS
jgi:hypothetical protein